MNRVDLALRLRDTVAPLPGVARWGGGPVEVSTQFPGGKVAGVTVSGPRVEIHIVVDEVPVTVVADRVHAAAERVLRDAHDPRPVAVVVTGVDVDRLPPIPGR